MNIHKLNKIKKKQKALFADTHLSFSSLEQNTSEKKEPKTVDIFFSSIIEKSPSPPPSSQSQDQEQQTLQNNSDTNLNNIKKEEYHPIPYSLFFLNDKNVINENQTNPIFTNLEIKTKIDKLSTNEFCEIFKIIKNNNEKYTTNQNGIFINLSSLKKISIIEICNFLCFSENNNKLFEQEEQTRDIYREMLL